jgi:FMN hydrolase / 5-amino-6-(5-phospho-D-ribitylamino)uracil phosphatase
MIRALCLDLMGTLIVDPYREALTAGTGLDLAILRTLQDRSAWPDFEIASIDEAEFVRRFFADPGAGHALDIDAFHRARRSGYAWLPGMPELLAEVEGRVDRYVASNYPAWIEDVREAFDLDGCTEGVWASHHLGVRKPDRRFFELLLDKIGHDPVACLFVDDRPDNCAGAEAAGLRSHLFTDADDLRARLRTEGVLDGTKGPRRGARRLGGHEDL